MPQTILNPRHGITATTSADRPMRTTELIDLLRQCPDHLPVLVDGGRAIFRIDRTYRNDSPILSLVTGPVL